MLQTADSAVIQRALFGGSEGDSFNDLQTLGWPNSKPLNVNYPISKIEVRHGWVVDALNVTYNRAEGGTQTINHGAQSGGGANTVEIGADEVITSIVGKAGPHTFYKKDLVEQITFIIANTKTGQVRLAGPFGNGDQSNQGAYFQASGVQAFAGVQTHGAQTGISGLSLISSQAWA